MFFKISTKFWKNHQFSLIDSTIYQENLMIFQKFCTVLKKHWLFRWLETHSTRLLFNISCCAWWFIYCLAFFWSLSIAYFYLGPVTFFDCFTNGLLLECDLTIFFKVFLTNWNQMGEFIIRSNFLFVIFGPIQYSLSGLKLSALKFNRSKVVFPWNTSNLPHNSQISTLDYDI